MIATTLQIVPLGGLGEFGMNMMAVVYDDTTVLIDAGVMFPEAELLGVDLIIPDLTFLQHRAQSSNDAGGDACRPRRCRS